MSNLLANELKRSKYRLLGLVGQGQFGRVYCASHRKTGHLFALKELDKNRFPTHKFLRELRFLISLQHKNIVTCHALEHIQTRRYLVMDYCEGGTLRNLLEADIQLSAAMSLKLIIDVLAGLEHAHQHGIIHCDIKPENILLSMQSQAWTARISDFGVARLSQELATEDGGNTGSPAYMAPERFYGQHSFSSDLYAVGILLFELFAGHRPFSGTPVELMAAHMNQPVKLSSKIPIPLHSVILTALQKLQARRYRSATEMLVAVRAAIVEVEALGELDWAEAPLLRSRAKLAVALSHAAKQESLASEVRQIVVSSAITEIQPKENQLSDRRLLVTGNRVVCQAYPNGVLAVPTETELPVTVRLVEPLQELVLRPNGYFAITRRSIYLIPFSLLHPSPNQPGQKRLQLSEPTLSPSNTVPELITEFDSDFLAAIAPNGRWLTTASQTTKGYSKTVAICRLGQSRPDTCKTIRPISQLFQLLVLDAYHLITFSHLVDAGTESYIKGVSLEVFTRRGNALGTLTLPLALQRVLPTASPYKLLAMEPGQPQSILLIDLKPLQMRRVALEIMPTHVAVATWGYVLMAMDGRITLLNPYGETVGQIAGPAYPSAIALAPPYSLLVATWHQAQGTLHTIDLRQLNLDLVF